MASRASSPLLDENIHTRYGNSTSGVNRKGAGPANGVSGRKPSVMKTEEQRAVAGMGAKQASSTESDSDDTDANGKLEVPVGTTHPVGKIPKISKIDKYGKPLAAPRSPNASERTYTTEYYHRHNQIYNFTLDNKAEKAGTFRSNLKIWRNYTLVMRPDIKTIQQFLNANIPTVGVRLDDHLAGIAAQHFSKKQLSENWPADFDKKDGMKRARCMPLGHPSKSYHAAREVDMDGKVLGPSEAGFYYNWHRGLQLLCGSEGYNANNHLIRPSNEKEPGAPNSLLWKKRYPARVNLPVGDPNDPTPNIPKLAPRPVGTGVPKAKMIAANPPSLDALAISARKASIAAENPHSTNSRLSEENRPDAKGSVGDAVKDFDDDLSSVAHPPKRRRIQSAHAGEGLFMADSEEEIDGE